MLYNLLHWIEVGAGAVILVFLLTTKFCLFKGVFFLGQGVPGLDAFLAIRFRGMSFQARSFQAWSFQAWSFLAQSVYRKKALTRESGAQVGLFDEKTRGRKNLVTLSL
jgi:hypothetical protein